MHWSTKPNREERLRGKKSKSTCASSVPAAVCFRRLLRHPDPLARFITSTGRRAGERESERARERANKCSYVGDGQLNLSHHQSPHYLLLSILLPLSIHPPLLRPSDLMLNRQESLTRSAEEVESKDGGKRAALQCISSINLQEKVEVGIGKRCYIRSLLVKVQIWSSAQDGMCVTQLHKVNMWSEQTLLNEVVL